MKNLSRKFATMTDEAQGRTAAGDDRAPTDWPSVNVGQTERWASGVAGAALIGYGLGRRRLRGVLLPIGLGLIGRAVTGRCPVNRALGRDTARGGEGSSPVASLEAGEGTRLEQSVVIARPRGELFLFWRRFDNLPRFMDNLESVTLLDGRRSHWVAKGPLGARVEWDAEIHNEIPDELIAWRSLPGSDVDQAGSVHFMPGHGGGTEVRVVLRYAAPAGKVGEAIGHVLGEDAGQQIADDLRRFKQVMEAGEVPTAF
jgi:uncharacterized membrane protein